MDWFTTKGQAVQTITPIVGLLVVFTGLFVAAKYGEPAMSSGHFSSAGAVIFYVIMVLVSALSVFAIWFSSRKWKERIRDPEKLPSSKDAEKPPVLVFSRDEADKEKIARVFQTHGKDASEKIQNVAEELYGQLYDSGSEEKQLIARLARNLLSRPCNLAHKTLSQALDEKKDNSSTLQKYLGDLFLSYFALVFWIHEMKRFSEKQVFAGKEYVLWQEYHRLFLDDMRRLYGEGDFSSLQKRIAEGQRGITG